MSEEFKYQSHEEAEKGYKELSTLIGKKDIEIRETKEASEKSISELKSQYVAPNSYTLPSDIELNDITRQQLDLVGKEAALTQSQYTALAKQLINQANESKKSADVVNQENQQKLESIDGYTDKKDKLDIYISQHYSDATASIIKDNLNNPDYFTKLWDEREKSVASTDIPAGGTTQQPKFDMEGFLAIRKKMVDNPHIPQYRDDYMAAIEQKAALKKIS